MLTFYQHLSGPKAVADWSRVILREEEIFFSIPISSFVKKCIKKQSFLVNMSVVAKVISIFLSGWCVLSTCSPFGIMTNKILPSVVLF